MILSIETSTEVCSVAIHRNGKLVDYSFSKGAYSHAENLAPIINQILKRNSVDKSDLLAIAVSAGPGSYTGLRIGASTAKGLCYALDIPLIDIGTLESMLIGLGEEYKNYLLCPMLDARRMEVYCLLANFDAGIIEQTQAKIIDETSFSNYLNDRCILFYGSGADKCKSLITNEKAKFLDNIAPSATNIGTVAYAKYVSGEFADLAYFEPTYLKEFKAIKAKNPLL